MEEPFNWKQFWEVNPAGKRKKENIANRKKLRKQEVRERKKWRAKQPKQRGMKITIPQWVAFSLYDEGAKTSKLYKYIDEPVERYEIKGKEIIRTVSTFHYLSQQIAVNGICRSFNELTRRRNLYMKLTGKERIFNVYDEIEKEFRKRYYIGRVMPMDFSKSDLDKDIHVSRIKMNHIHYVFISLKDKFSDTWGRPKMLRLTQRVARAINTKIDLHLTQEQIIERIKSGKIKNIHPFGNPDGIISNEKVLEMLK